MVNGKGGRMKLEVGLYVRTLNGIGKINDYINNNYTQKFTYINNCGCAEFLEENQVIKASHNIIDLIEVGDYVNGKLVTDIKTDYIFDYSEEILLIYFSETDYIYSSGGIKSIVTKEMFSSISYEVSK